MTPRCQEQQARLVAFARGELRHLERDRVAAHLGGCRDCEQTVRSLRAGLQQAARWEPEVFAGDLAHLNQRLEPYLGEGRVRRSRRRLGLAWGSLTALTAAALAVVVWRPFAVSTPVVAPARESVALGPIAVGDGLRRERATPHLVWVASRDWDGRVEGTEENLSVTMSTGFAVFDFVGGGDRHLRVSAPDALVDVVGTRFFVEVRDGATKVGVARGKVRVLTLAGTEMLQGGDSLAVGEGDGSDAAALAYIRDPFLGDAPLPVPRRNVTRPGPSSRTRLGVLRNQRPLDGYDPFAAWDRAEALSRQGDPRAAIEVFNEITRAAEQTAVRDAARYEIARLWGLRLGEVQRARDILRPLAQRGNEELRRQASLALCELELQHRPCASAACLDTLRRAKDEPLRQEAARLYARWGLGELTCELH